MKKWLLLLLLCAKACFLQIHAADRNQEESCDWLLSVGVSAGAKVAEGSRVRRGQLLSHSRGRRGVKPWRRDALHTDQYANPSGVYSRSFSL